MLKLAKIIFKPKIHKMNDVHHLADNDKPIRTGAGVFRALDSEDWGGVGVLSGFSLLMSSRIFFPVWGSKIASGFFSLCGA